MWTVPKKLGIEFSSQWKANQCQQSVSRKRRRLWPWAPNPLSRLEVSESVSIRSCFSSVFSTLLVATCPSSKRFSSMNWQPCPHPCLTTAVSWENLANTHWQSTCGMPVKVASSKCWNRRCSLYPWWWLFNSPTVLAERHILQALSWEVCWVCEEIIPSCDSRLWWVFWGSFHQRHGPCSKKHPAWPWSAVYSWHVALGEKGGVPLQYHQQTAVHSSCWKMLGGEWYSGAACSGGCWLCHSSGGTSVCHGIRYSSRRGRYRPTHSSFSCQVRHEGCVLLLNQGKCNKTLGDQKNAELSQPQCVQEYLICTCIWWLRHHFSAFRCRKICPCEETATKEQTVWKWCQGFPAD